MNVNLDYEDWKPINDARWQLVYIKWILLLILTAILYFIHETVISK